MTNDSISRGRPPRSDGLSPEELLHGQELVDSHAQCHQAIPGTLELQLDYHSTWTPSGASHPKHVRVAPHEGFAHQLGVQFLERGEIDSVGVLRSVRADQSLDGHWMAENHLERGILQVLVPVCVGEGRLGIGPGTDSATGTD